MGAERPDILSAKCFQWLPLTAANTLARVTADSLEHHARRVQLAQVPIRYPKFTGTWSNYSHLDKRRHYEG
jgi:hypothetical protein